MCKTLKLGLLAFAVLGITFLGCDKLNAPITPDDPGKTDVTDFPYTTNIIAGQNDDVGNIVVNVDGDSLYIDMNTTGNWFIKDWALDVAADLEGLAHNRQDILNPGQFPYHSDPSFTATQAVHIAISWDDIDELMGVTPLYFAVHVNVAQSDNGSSGPFFNGNTGWGEGPRYNPDHWGMYFTTDMPKTIHLPDYGVMVRYVQVSGSTPSMFEITGINEPGYNIWNGTWPSFCLDQNIYIYNQWYRAMLENTTYPEGLPGYIYYNRCGIMVTPWDKINFLVDYYMDNYHPGTAAEIAAFQTVFWFYRGIGSIPPSGLAHDLYDLAEAQGGGYFPDPGDYFAVALDINCCIQLCFVMVDP